jgi:hypothetical protein
MTEIVNGWVEYEPAARRLGQGEAIALVGKGSSIRLTQEAIDSIGQPPYVVFLFDRQGQRVAIRASRGEVRHAFPLKRYGGGKVWVVAAGGFLKWANIAHDRRRDFAVQTLDDHTLVFQIDSGREALGEFEEFIHKSVAISQIGPNVSISRNGNVTMNLATRKLLGDADRVVLMYNETNRLMGIRPASVTDRHAASLRPASTQRTWTLSAEGFLKRFSIPHDEGRSYEPKVRDGVLVVDLNSPKPSRRRAEVRG